jgi:hypothetical protein
MNEQDRMLAEHACQRLCMAFHVHVDAYQNNDIVALFAEDAVWHHKSGLLKGHGDIAAYLNSKSTYPIVRHLVTNVLIDVEDPNSASGVAYVTVFYAEPGKGAPLLQEPIVLATYYDTFTCTDNGWRFASRRPELTLHSRAFATMINTREDERRLRPQ